MSDPKDPNDMTVAPPAVPAAGGETVDGPPPDRRPAAADDPGATGGYESDQTTAPLPMAGGTVDYQPGTAEAEVDLHSQATVAPEEGRPVRPSRSLGVWGTPGTSSRPSRVRRQGGTPEEERLEQLLDRWEEGRDQGNAPTAEDLCRDCPELLEPLRRRIEQLSRVDAFVRDRGRSSQAPGLPPIAGYEVLGVLGRGAMGVVYKARQVGLNRLVALKMILAGEHAGEHEVARFRTEAEAVARLQHPNIVQIYEVGEDGGRPYFSLEFVSGGSLDKKFAGTPQPPRAAGQLLHQLAGAMDCAHQMGVIHRDLKPANILLTADGTPKISDFGLAKRLEEDAGQTHSGAILGTPNYMSPEQADGNTHAIGPHSDVYALGVILYEALTGRVPFRGPTVLDTLQQVRSREPVAPTLLQPKLPRDLETICLKCLQKDAKKRYESAGALAADLGRFLKGEPILARPVGRLERAWRWCRRNPLGAAAVGAVVLWAVSMSALALALKFQKDETVRQKAEAVRQKTLAEDNEREANRQKAEALVQKGKAETNWRIAEKRGDVLKDRQQKAFNLGSKLVEEMLKRLQARRVVLQAGAEIRTLREALLEILRKSTLAMAQEMESTGATSFGTLATHQQIGDMLRRLGQGQEALRHFKKGTELARQLVKALPNEDKSRANLGMMLLRLGDMELELRGDALAARDYYRDALRRRQDVIDHPRSHDFAPRDHTIGLSHHHLRLAKVELDLGNPTAAWEHFHKLLQLRTAWWKDHPDNDVERGLLAEAWMWHGVGAWHVADEARTREGFREALALIEGLVRKYPRAFWFKEDLAEVQGNQGDALLRLGKVEEAKKSYAESLKNLKVALAHRPEETAYQALLARTEERLAVIAAREGDPKEAARHYKEALRLGGELIRLESNNLSWQAAYLRALAYCGKEAEAARLAEGLAKRNRNSPVLLLETARCFAACATGATTTEARTRYCVRALEAVRAALAVGYKDHHALRTDPDLEVLQKKPAYQALLAALAKR